MRLEDIGLLSGIDTNGSKKRETEEERKIGMKQMMRKRQREIACERERERERLSQMEHFG